MADDRKNIIITGASGFLGGAMVRAFAQQGRYRVTATARRDITQMANEYVSTRHGDLCDLSFCNQLTPDTDCIVHCAALSSPWGSYSDFEAANITSTKLLLDSAIKNKVRRFIYISTPSIYFNYKDRLNISETDPLPNTMVNWYAETKLAAEQYVLSKNNMGIETLSLRPRAIIGAGDTTIFPRLLKAHTEKKLRIIGDGENICDLTCVNNVIHATQLAIEVENGALGLAYNITDGSPVKLWDVINYVFGELGFPAVSRKVPFSIVAAYAAYLEWKSRIFQNNKEPALTRFGVGVLAGSLTMNINSARDLLRYSPVQTTQEGINEFISWFKGQQQ